MGEIIAIAFTAICSIAVGYVVLGEAMRKLLQGCYWTCAKIN